MSKILDQKDFVACVANEMKWRGIKKRYDLLRLKCRKTVKQNGKDVFCSGGVYTLWAAYREDGFSGDVFYVAVPGESSGYEVERDVFQGAKSAVKASEVKVGERCYVVAADFCNRLILIRKDNLTVARVKSFFEKRYGKDGFYTVLPRVFENENGMFVGFRVVKTSKTGKRIQSFCFNSFFGAEENMYSIFCEIPIGVNQCQIRWRRLRVSFPAPQECIKISAKR